MHNITIAYKCLSRLARAVSGAINHPGSEYAQGCLLNKHIIMYMNPCLSTATIIIPIPYTSIDETLRISFSFSLSCLQVLADHLVFQYTEVKFARSPKKIMNRVPSVCLQYRYTQKENLQEKELNIRGKYSLMKLISYFRYMFGKMINGKFGYIT